MIKENSIYFTLGKDLNIYSLKKITKNHMKNSSTASDIRKMQIKTTMRYYFTSTMIAQFRKIL